MSVRKRGPRSYQVRVAGFPAQTAPTKEAAEKIELDLKRRKALGDLWEAPAMTLGEAIDRTARARRDGRGGSREDGRAQPTVREAVGAAAWREALDGAAREGGRRHLGAGV